MNEREMKFREKLEFLSLENYMWHIIIFNIIINLTHTRKLN